MENGEQPTFSVEPSSCPATPPAANNIGNINEDAASGGVVRGTTPASLPVSSAAVPAASCYSCRVYGVVAMVSLLWFVSSAMESGTNPCVLTSQQQAFNATVTEVTIAQAMIDVGKILGGLVAGVLGNQGRNLGLSVFVGVAAIAGGSAASGASEKSWQLGLSQFLAGLGVALLSSLAAPLFDFLVPTTLRQRAAVFIGAMYATGYLGVAGGFVVCGLTVECCWRWNYYGEALALALLVGPFIVLERFSSKDSPNNVLRTGGGEEHAHPHRTADTRVMNGDPPTLTSLSDRARLVLQGMALVVSNPAIRWTSLAISAIYFAIAAYSVLLSLFIERQLKQSRETAGYVLAATVPAVALATLVGGMLNRRCRFSVERQLQYGLVLAVVTFVAPFCFLVTELSAFIAYVVIAMIILFLRAAPAITLLAQAARRDITGIDDADAAFNDSDLTEEQIVEQLQSVLHISKEDARAIESRVAYANSICYVSMRVFGSLPGPIVLAALIDAGFSLPVCFVAIGVVCCGLHFICSGLAWWQACRCCRDRVAPRRGITADALGASSSSSLPPAAAVVGS